MVWGLICLVFLYLGYKLNSRKIETEFGTDIHSLPESYGDAASTPLSYRRTQLLQFGLTFGVEGFFGAVIGVVYGPLTMIWCVLGSVFLGSFLNYYSGMYSRAHHKSLLSVAEEVFGRKIYLALTLIFCVLLLLGTSVNFMFFLNVVSHAFHPDWLWYAFLLVVVGIVFLSSQRFNKVCMAVGAMILLSTLYLCIMSVAHFANIEVSNNPLNYPNLKYAYPFLFITVNIGVLSGIQALKCTLTAEHIRNERMGKGVFIATTLFQAGMVVLWGLLLLAWNPSLKVLTSAISKEAMPDIVLHKYLTVHTGVIGEYAVTVTLAAVCILSAGVMLRLISKLLKEAGIASKLEHRIIGVVLSIMSALFLFFPSVMHGYELINQLIVLYLLYTCIYLRRKQKQSYKHLLFIAYILSGACVAYLLMAVLRLPLNVGVFSGLTCTFCACVGHYFYHKKV
ncbi:MAG: hypothetical protein J6N49_03880 [Alphaproteobacteria bacterium]|nr:hypothetical protein [Alphaproteobacteria bacterium]